jgi:erythromycin esterase-like protein
LPLAALCSTFIVVRREEINVGQLMREHYGMDRVFNIGFSTYTGTVTAANEWDEPAH